ncbi:hypothetical protein I551_8471 [Mycobacterium ulcerans str. Harvey]|uniref:Uncharacterized protein n=1 Tax=Mycobacterium ulcerans str. Harvey TaxID=1299332 RepID=A0ABN0RAX9_MYCUL|nr:hypothetical protein I551_8471 [Mycobacterium ulcerans str. Harvey]
MTISQLDPAGYMDAFRRGLECNTDPHSVVGIATLFRGSGAEIREKLTIPPQAAPAVQGGTSGLRRC